MQLTERLGVPRRKPRERSAGLVEVLVDDDAGAVAKRRALLDWRLDIRKAETVKFQVADQRRMAESHKEVGVQVEAIARQSRLFRGATATDVGVSFDHRDFQTGSCQIGRKRESVVSGSDDDTIEFFHWLSPARPQTLLHESTLDHGVDTFVAVDELCHAQVAGKAAEDVGLFRAPALHFDQPAYHVAQRLPGGIIEIRIEAHRDVVRGGHRSRHVELLVLVQHELEGAGQASFERGQADLAVALHGVSVAGGEVWTGHGNGQVEGGIDAKLLVVLLPPNSRGSTELQGP